MTFAEHSLPTVTLTRLVAAGKLERVSRGVYSLPGRRLSEHRSLAEASLRVPQGVVCLLSALRVHGIGTQAPFEVWLAIPQNAPIPRLDQPSLRVVRMSGAALEEGIEVKRIDGVKVRVFSAEKTVSPTASSSATRSDWTWRSKRCAMDGRAACCRWTSSRATRRPTASPM